MSCLDILWMQCPMLVYVRDTSPHYSFFLVSWCYEAKFWDFWRMEKEYLLLHDFFILAYVCLTAFYIVLSHHDFLQISFLTE